MIGKIEKNCHHSEISKRGHYIYSIHDQIVFGKEFLVTILKNCPSPANIQKEMQRSIVIYATLVILKIFCLALSKRICV